jgi:hypothetical protein
VTERLLAGCEHMCRVDWVCGAIGALSAADVDGIGLVVLRQPTRKEMTLRSDWGAISWCVEFRGYTGPAITLDATDCDRPWLNWSRSLSPDDMLELERMRDHLFNVQPSRRGYSIELDSRSVAVWQLCRTLPHEVGHWVDFRLRVIEPLGVATAAEAVAHPGYRERLERWSARPHREAEEFANRYADSVQDAIEEYVLRLAG